MPGAGAGAGTARACACCGAAVAPAAAAASARRARPHPPRFPRRRSSGSRRFPARRRRPRRSPRSPPRAASAFATRAHRIERLAAQAHERLDGQVHAPSLGRRLRRERLLLLLLLVATPAAPVEGRVRGVRVAVVPRPAHAGKAHLRIRRDDADRAFRGAGRPRSVDGCSRRRRSRALVPALVLLVLQLVLARERHLRRAIARLLLALRARLRQQAGVRGVVVRLERRAPGVRRERFRKKSPEERVSQKPPHERDDQERAQAHRAAHHRREREREDVHHVHHLRHEAREDPAEAGAGGDPARQAAGHREQVPQHPKRLRQQAVRRAQAKKLGVGVRE